MNVVGYDIDRDSDAARAALISIRTCAGCGADLPGYESVRAYRTGAIMVSCRKCGDEAVLVPSYAQREAESRDDAADKAFEERRGG